MNNRESYLKKNQLPWLLEGDNPSVRYFTMIDLLDKPRDCPEVVRAKQKILQKGVVPKILAKQKEEGYWEEADKFYTNKYKGTVWQILILAALGVNKNDDIRIEKACEFLLNHSQDKISSGFFHLEKCQDWGW